MASSGPNSPGTVVSDATVGTVAWSNPTNAGASDNVYAVATTTSETTVYSHYLKATNFGFSIPTGATIDGILVEIERKKVGGIVSDSEIKIVKSDGTIGTTNKSVGTAWSTTEGYVSFGGAADLWGETWAVSNINDVDFGVVISSAMSAPVGGATSYVDHIRITVYYTEAAGNTSAFFQLF